MADYFCDHGVYGLASNRLGLDAPTTWAVPQEGDGSALTAAAASAVGSIAFAAVPLTGTISVCGVTVSTTGVIGAITTTSAADALATNINTTATAVASGVAIGLPQLRNLVYARGPTNGAPADTCQIMMRIGSLRLNNATNSNCAIATTFDGSPTLVQFIGGTGGCWGWFSNPTALGVDSSIAVIGYGCFIGLPYVTATGVITTVADTIWVRTGGGASKAITANAGAGVAAPHAAYSKNLVFDTNTQWTGDSAVGTLKLIWTTTANSNTASSINSAANQTNTFVALRRGGFEIEYVGSSTSSNNNYLVLGAFSGNAVVYEYWKNVVFRDSGTYTSTGRSYLSQSLASGNGGSSATLVRENCDWIITTPRSAIVSSPFIVTGFGTTGYQCYRGCTWDYNISGTAYPGQLLNIASIAEADLILQGCHFLGYATGYTLGNSFGGWITNGTRLNLVVDNCSGLLLPVAYAGFPTSTGLFRQDTHSMVTSLLNGTSPQGMRVEDNRGVAEWVPNDPTPFPTLAATLPGSGISWSLRVFWIQVVPLTKFRTYESPPLRLTHQLATGARTITLNMFNQVSIASASGAKFAVAYTDSGGIARTEFTEATSTNTAAWTNTASYAGYVKQQMSLTTAYPVLANSEIIGTLILTAAAPAATTALYLDPELVVA